MSFDAFVLIRVTWDEEVIEEHNKLRGTRMKIDEPDTPFEHGDGVEAASDDEEDVPVQGELEVVQVGKNGIEAKVAAAAEQKSTPSQIASLSDQWASLEGKLEAAASEADAGTLKVGAVKVAQEEGVRQKKKDFKVVIWTTQLKLCAILICVVFRTNVQHITMNSSGLKR